MCDLILFNANAITMDPLQPFAQLIAVEQGKIKAVAGNEMLSALRNRNTRIVVCAGRALLPGFIDAHVHIESSMVPPREFARAVLPHGITSVVSDPHEIANVLGLEGIRFMLQDAKYGPLSVFVVAPSCVPATHMETSGSQLEFYDLATRLESHKKARDALQNGLGPTGQHFQLRIELMELDLEPFRKAVVDVPKKFEAKWGAGLYEQIRGMK